VRYWARNFSHVKSSPAPTVAFANSGNILRLVWFRLLSPESPLIYLCRVFPVTTRNPPSNPADTLYSPFLLDPSENLFPVHELSAYAHHALPGAIVVKDEHTAINRGRERVRIKVTNSWDRPVQVSPSCSHRRIRCGIKGYRLESSRDYEAQNDQRLDDPGSKIRTLRGVHFKPRPLCSPQSGRSPPS
jgi:hypothetical protein